MILYFTPGGRIGNQLFQFAKIVSIVRPGELVVFGLMEQFLSIFLPSFPVWNLRRGLVHKFFEKAIVPVIRLLFVKTNIISSVIEQDGLEKNVKGLISSITWVEGYFQNRQYALTFQSFKLRSVYNIEAQKFLVDNNLTGVDWLFVHVRRTDYLQYEVLGEVDPSLPAAYYVNAIHRLGFKAGDCPVVIVGDDPGFISPILLEKGWHVIVSDLSAGADFSLMSLAPYGVISNSTFAWWSAKIGRKRIVAPLYWLGWKSSTWYPSGLFDDSFEWIEVSQ